MSYSLSEEELRRLSEYLVKLKPIGELAQKLHFEGLSREELIELLNSVKDVLDYLAREQGSKLERVMGRIERLKEIIAHLPPWIFPLSPGKAIKDLASFLKSLQPIRPLGVMAPAPPDLGRLLEEVNVLVEVLIYNFNKHVRMLVTLFDAMKPDLIPHIIKIARGNPGYIKGPLGEALCIWWLLRALSVERSIWSEVKGPIRVYNREIDAISTSIDLKTGTCRYTIAEIANSKNPDELEEAIEQLVVNIKFLAKPEVISQVACSSSVKRSICEEASIVTLYSISQEGKVSLKKRLEELLNREGLSCSKIEVYDINNIITSIKGFTGKERYIELFKTLNEILEKI